MRLPDNLVSVHRDAMTAMTLRQFDEWMKSHDGHEVTVSVMWGYARVFCHDCATLPEDEVMTRMEMQA